MGMLFEHFTIQRCLCVGTSNYCSSSRSLPLLITCVYTLEDRTRIPLTVPAFISRRSPGEAGHQTSLADGCVHRAVLEGLKLRTRAGWAGHGGFWATATANQVGWPGQDEVAQGDRCFDPERVGGVGQTMEGRHQVRPRRVVDAGWCHRPPV